jgi:hypothetical protein
MKLLPRYASMLGLQIGKQHLLEQFFPLSFSRYITLHAGSGMPGKNYPSFAEVVNLIKPYLAAAHIEIVQLGAKEDGPIPGCHHTMGQTSKHQANYLVGRSMLHLANDSIWCHRAGHLGIPLVELFATTSEANHAPYQFGSKTRFVSSHRRGHNPTFAMQESPSTAAFIDPFTVARAVLDLLEIPHTITQHTLLAGQAYNATMLDWIPDQVVAPGFNPELPLAARLDIHHDENVLAATLNTGRKANIVCKAPIALPLLAHFKPSIQTLSFEVNEDTPLDYVLQLKKTLQGLTFFSRESDAKKLSDIRFKFFDVVNVQHLPHKTRADFERESAEYTNRPVEEVKIDIDNALKSGNLKFKTQKFVLNKGKIYLSLAHAAADIPMEGDKRCGTVIDSPEFWRDLNHFMLYA